MTEAVGAAKGERTANRGGYRSGYFGRTLITRVGKLELRVPQDRDGRFSTELFERYQRSERALVAALAEMYVQGVSTRKGKAITEELCGHSFSASSISAINKKLDESLAQFARRRLTEALPYLILDARYERVREAGVIARQAVLIAIGIDWDGRRQVLGIELANRESRSSWRDFLLGLRQRGLAGVEFIVADDHAGLKAAIREVLPEAAYQRCYVHTIQTQSTMRLIGRSVPAWRWTAQRDDMADLQAVFVNDDALDDELQDSLLVGKARCVETAADAVAEGGQGIQHRLGFDLLAAELLLLDTLLLEACALLGQRAPSLGEFLKADRLGLIGIDQPPIGAGEPVEPRLDLLLGACCASRSAPEAPRSNCASSCSGSASSARTCVQTAVSSWLPSTCARGQAVWRAVITQSLPAQR